MFSKYYHHHFKTCLLFLLVQKSVSFLLHPQFSFRSGHSGYRSILQYISSKQNKKSGNKETLCSHTAWELKTNIPPHQIYINWYQLSSVLSSGLSSTCDWNAQKDGFLDQSWIIEYNNHQTVGNMLGLCTHWKCMSQPFLLLLLMHSGLKIEKYCNK